MLWDHYGLYKMMDIDSQCYTGYDGNEYTIGMVQLAGLQYTYLSQNKAADDLGLFFNRLTHRPIFLNLLMVFLDSRKLEWWDRCTNVLVH